MEIKAIPTKGPVIPAVRIKPVGDKINVQWDILILFNEKNGKRSCYLPGYDINFSATSADMVNKKSMMLTKFFFDNFLLHNKKNGLKRLVLELHKMGFKAKNDVDTIHKLINNKLVPAQFKQTNPSLPKEFADSAMISSTSQLETDFA